VVLTPRPARIVLEHALALAPDRTPSLRTEPSYAAEMRVLQGALRSGGQE
jgi:NitT/TauT family transport system ATP-binding protein